MTTPYNSHNESSAMSDLIDKHVPMRTAALGEHYAKADETRALLKRLGIWPTTPGRAILPRGKKPKTAKTASELGQEAYLWAADNGATYAEAAERFKTTPDSIHSYRQYRKLPTLPTK